jgi:hypothetical protein
MGGANSAHARGMPIVKEPNTETHMEITLVRSHHCTARFFVIF